jgi:hypothetical protein
LFVLGWNICPAGKKFKKIILKKYVIFCKFIIVFFNQYQFVFLYYKNINLVLKYPVFLSRHQKNKNKNILFSCMQQSLSKIKKLKNHILFSYNKFQKICISMYFGFNNQFIKVTKTKPIFQKFQNKIYFIFF